MALEKKLLLSGPNATATAGRPGCRSFSRSSRPRIRRPSSKMPSGWQTSGRGAPRCSHGHQKKEAEQDAQRPTAVCREDPAQGLARQTQAVHRGHCQKAQDHARNRQAVYSALRVMTGVGGCGRRIARLERRQAVLELRPESH